MGLHWPLKQPIHLLREYVKFWGGSTWHLTKPNISQTLCSEIIKFFGEPYTKTNLSWSLQVVIRLEKPPPGMCVKCQRFLDKGYPV